VGAADGPRSSLGQTEMLYLTFLDQIFHGSRDILDGHVEIDPMLVEQVNGIDPQSAERGLGNLLDVFWPAVERGPSIPIAWTCLPAELGGDHYLAAERSEGFAHQFFVGERVVHLRGIEEVTPRSTAARSNAIISRLSFGGPYDQLIAMQPRPMAETSRFFPSVRVIIAVPFLNSNLCPKAVFE